ncbi:MAG: hypothetical protein FJW20_09880 [Acidimicrobiia bacterium]|nr:hypothetical protein [Acidimicrobiia bacterium]
MTLFATDSKAWYDGLQTSFRQRFRNSFTLDLGYTFSKAIDQAPVAILTSGNPVTGDMDRWYDPNAFELPQAGFFGNLGRNTLIGPPFANFDLPGNAQNATSARFIFTDTSGRANLAATRPVKTTNDPREIQFALKLIW